MLGPTASGKSELAVSLAEATGGEVLSVDSMQVYRGMDIGTAKPDAAMRARVPHHLLDLADPRDVFSVADFQREGAAVFSRLAQERATPVVAGGSGLHFRSLVDPMRFPPTDDELRAKLEESDPDVLRAELLDADPSATQHVDLANARRVLRAVEVLRLTGVSPSQRAAAPAAAAVRAYEGGKAMVAVGLDPGAGLAGRVEQRFDRMLGEGLLSEVAGLADRLGPTARQAVGYQQLLAVVRGEASLDAGRQAAISASLALAKRQRTFFRRDPRIRWLPWSDDPAERCRVALSVVEEARAWSS